MTSGIGPAPRQPGFKPAPDAPGTPSGRRRVPSNGTPDAAREGHGQETPPVAPRPPSPEEVENDPLVKSVLDVFGGEIKRVHPKNP